MKVFPAATFSPMAVIVTTTRHCNLVDRTHERFAKCVYCCWFLGFAVCFWIGILGVKVADIPVIFVVPAFLLPFMVFCVPSTQLDSTG